MALCPAVVHPVEHFCPVLRLCAACAGVECQNGIGAVIFAGQQGCQFQRFQFLDETVCLFVQLGVGLFFALFHGQFNEGEDVIFHLLILVDAVFQGLYFLEYLLGILQIAVKIRVCHLLLQFVITCLCLFNAQHLVQFFQVFAVVTHCDTQFI